MRVKFYLVGKGGEHARWAIHRSVSHEDTKLKIACFVLLVALCEFREVLRHYAICHRSKQPAQKTLRRCARRRRYFPDRRARGYLWHCQAERRVQQYDRGDERAAHASWWICA